MRMPCLGALAIGAVGWVFACGGTSAEDEASPHGGEGAGVGGSGVGGSGGGSAGERVVPERCQLPQDAGSCDGYFPSYTYNADADRCEEFIYGGCDGNDNRFATFSDCEAVCRPGQTRTEMDACRLPTDCALASTSCCEPCEPVDLNQFVAVNVGYVREVPEDDCSLVDCADCPTMPIGSQNVQDFGVTCEDGRCVAFDVREHALSACSADSDCVLRADVSCCEGCAYDAAPTAVNPDTDLVSVLCGAPVPCLTCDSIFPPNAVTACGSNGHCVVTYTGP